MTGERVVRRLAAILAADVVGYSRLMGRDESGTLALLREHRKHRFEPTLARHGGRLVKLTGDGSLVEFPSAQPPGAVRPDMGTGKVQDRCRQSDSARPVRQIAEHVFAFSLSASFDVAQHRRRERRSLLNEKTTDTRKGLRSWLVTVSCSNPLYLL